jgi:cell division protein FtsZ
MREKIEFTPDYGKKINNSIIKVIGVGGGGNNAVKHMYSEGIIGVDFLICNTDRQVLESNQVPSKLVLGDSGLGAGAKPDVAREYALNSREKIIEFIGKDTKMLFITAGMGKGTGTGAAPVIAQIAKDMGILTIGVVTFPLNLKAKLAHDLLVKELRKCRNMLTH